MEKKVLLPFIWKGITAGFPLAVEQNTNIEMASQLLQVYVNRLPSQGKFFSKPVVL